MLVLTRKPGERIVITIPGAAPVVVEVLEIRRRDCVRLGLAAPPAVRIDRAEVLDRPDPAAGPDYFRGVPK
jgi:carbon storage regulator CsrA